MSSTESQANTTSEVTPEAGQDFTSAGLRTSAPPSSTSNQPTLPNKKPSLPSNFFKFPDRTRLRAVQQYINSFEYKQSPQTSFNAHKLRPLARIMETAKMMIYNPQPIKCVEAVFLALYLTAGISDAERIPLGFKSEIHGQVHQHIVLLVRYSNKYGAFGISRQKTLMSKEFEFASLSSIVDDFKKAYEDIDHKVIRIRVGLPVEHNIASFNFVCWRYLSLDPSSTPWDQCSEALERHIKISKRLWIRWLLDGQRENKRADMFLSETDTKLDALETSENKSKRRHSGQSSAALVKAAKREKELEKPGPDMKYFEERQVLTDRPSIKKLRNRPPLTEVNIGVSCKYKIAPALPLKSPRTSRASSRRCLHCQKLRSEMQSVATPVEAHHKNIKKIALKCYSLELVPGSSTINEQLSLLNRQQRPRLHRDLVRNDLRKIKKNLRKSRSATPAESPPNSMNKRKNTFTRRADFR